MGDSDAHTYIHLLPIAILLTMVNNHFAKDISPETTAPATNTTLYDRLCEKQHDKPTARALLLYYGKRTQVLHKSMGKIFNLVCKESTKEQRVEWLRVPLQHAAAAGNVELANDMLAAGADASIAALHLVIRDGNEQVVGALFDSGASLNSYDDGDAAIHIAAKRGDEGIVALLLLKGADVNMLSTDGTSPLGLAAEYRHLFVTKALLVAGVSSRDGDG